MNLYHVDAWNFVDIIFIDLQNRNYLLYVLYLPVQGTVGSMKQFG